MNDFWSSGFWSSGFWAEGFWYGDAGDEGGPRHPVMLAPPCGRMGCK